MLFAASLALACSSRGVPFATERIGEIEPGVTRADDLRSWFGEPVGMERRSSGWATWRYVHEERAERDTGTVARVVAWLGYVFGLRTPLAARPPVNVVSGDTTRHELEVFLDAAGVVRDYRYAREEIPDRRVY